MTTTTDLDMYRAVTAARTLIRRGYTPVAAAWRASSALGLDTADESKVLELAAAAENAFDAWRAAADETESTTKGNDQ